MNKEYLNFEEIESKGKTKVYRVVTKRLIIESGVTPHPEELGIIKWYGPWRQYVFYPEYETLWNKGCLTQIINFLNKLMDERK